MRRPLVLLALLSLCSLLPAAASAETKLVLSNGAAADRFGWAVALQGDTLVVGATQDFRPGGTGTAYVFAKSNGVWTQSAELVRPGPMVFDAFGSDVAIDGDTIAVGAPAADTGFAVNTGAVYVFQRTNGQWSLQARVTPDFPPSFLLFGISVDLRGDRLAVGAWGDGTFGPISGSAFIFRRQQNTWVQEARLFASDPNNGDRFGVDVSLDGDRLVVGANGDTAFRGAAYVFENAGGLWTERAKLSPPAAAGAAQFGRRVHLQGDQVVAAAAEENGATGAVYVYGLVNSTWSLQSRLTAADGVATDRFGISARFMGDRLVVGAARYPSGSGAAYLFKATGAGWALQKKITAADGVAGDLFSFSAGSDPVRRSVVVIGAPEAEGSGSSGRKGAVYVYPALTASELVTEIEALVDSGVLNQGQGNSLIAKIEAARNQAARGNTAAAIAQLGSFIHEVEAMAAAGILTPDTAQALINAAQALIDELRAAP